MARKSKPWAVICRTPDGPFRTEHTSENKAYEKAREVRDAVKAGSSRVTWIRVEQWEPDASRWTLFDLIDPKEW
ncbi:hypothetical protein OG455_41575 [Kitasatospora sp. NBC_01287]|uniref:hypothetical protein n=1 Tax=Kitasatospora sp. NBC_01287 TaxID=2903573 RepID=UPI0022598363|nr:hypothetical protein [Kitasatospora sp. NBC_01287]MCX4750975.1 hypothetical protein [Kitasatospora sp. NBC_01287]MCX4751774.1 hypothetical protein [Kitasatospora sp. NBC_01287]MCX4751934.1 hypothetical protein [Kitasatospora sp. NBC_01287]